MLRQVEERTCFWFSPMLIASRAVLRQHREITAVFVTYGMFLGGVLGLAWAIS